MGNLNLPRGEHSVKVMIAVAHRDGESHGRDASNNDGRYKCSRNGNRRVAAFFSKVNGAIEPRVNKVGIHESS